MIMIIVINLQIVINVIYVMMKIKYPVNVHGQKKVVFIMKIKFQKKMKNGIQKY